MQNLLPNILIKRISNAAAAGTTDINAAVVDMQDYRGALCIAAVGTLTANQVTKLIAEQSKARDGTGDAFAKIAETTALADTDGNKLLILEVCEPQERYVRFTLDRGTANAVLDSMVVLLYRPRVRPTIKDVTVAVQALAASPNEIA